MPLASCLTPSDELGFGFGVATILMCWSSREFQREGDTVQPAAEFGNYRSIGIG
jgi:hypothetical protein